MKIPHDSLDPPPVTASGSDDVTRLLHEVQQGREGAADALAVRVYGELHELAAHFMRRERQDHTLQTTALVHEAFLRLLGNTAASWQNRSHFFGVAAQAMRRILVDHARRRGAGKRAGGERVTLGDAAVVAPVSPIDLVALDVALDKLAALEPRHARVVELRVFAGLTADDTAATMGISVATVKRDWIFARAFLQRELDDGDDA